MNVAKNVVQRLFDKRAFLIVCLSVFVILPTTATLVDATIIDEEDAEKEQSGLFESMISKTILSVANSLIGLTGAQDVSILVFQEKAIIDSHEAFFTNAIHADKSALEHGIFPQGIYKGISIFSSAFMGALPTPIIILLMLGGFILLFDVIKGDQERSRAKDWVLGLILAILTMNFGHYLWGAVIWLNETLVSGIYHLLTSNGISVTSFISTIWNTGATESIFDAKNLLVALIVLGACLTTFVINYQYMMRMITIGILIILFPVAILLLVIPSKRNVIFQWFNLFASNVFMQTGHAIAIGLFFFFLNFAEGFDFWLVLVMFFGLPTVTDLINRIVNMAFGNGFGGGVGTTMKNASGIGNIAGLAMMGKNMFSKSKGSGDVTGTNTTKPTVDYGIASSVLNNTTNDGNANKAMPVGAGFKDESAAFNTVSSNATTGLNNAQSTIAFDQNANSTLQNDTNDKAVNTTEQNGSNSFNSTENAQRESTQADNIPNGASIDKSGQNSTFHPTTEATTVATAETHTGSIPVSATGSNEISGGKNELTGNATTAMGTTIENSASDYGANTNVSDTHSTGFSGMNETSEGAPINSDLNASQYANSNSTPVPTSTTVDNTSSLHNVGEIPSGTNVENINKAYDESNNQEQFNADTTDGSTDHSRTHVDNQHAQASSNVIHNQSENGTPIGASVDPQHAPVVNNNQQQTVQNKMDSNSTVKNNVPPTAQSSKVTDVMKSAARVTGTGIVKTSEAVRSNPRLKRNAKTVALLSGAAAGYALSTMATGEGSKGAMSGAVAANAASKVGKKVVQKSSYGTQIAGEIMQSKGTDRKALDITKERVGYNDSSQLADRQEMKNIGKELVGGKTGTVVGTGVEKAVRFAAQKGVQNVGQFNPQQAVKVADKKQNLENVTLPSLESQIITQKQTVSHASEALKTAVTNSKVNPSKESTMLVKSSYDSFNAEKAKLQGLESEHSATKSQLNNYYQLESMKKKAEQLQRRKAE